MANKNLYEGRRNALFTRLGDGGVLAKKCNALHPYTRADVFTAKSVWNPVSTGHTMGRRCVELLREDCSLSWRMGSTGLHNPGDISVVGEYTALNGVWCRRGGAQCAGLYQHDSVRFSTLTTEVACLNMRILTGNGFSERGRIGWDSTRSGCRVAFRPTTFTSSGDVTTTWQPWRSRALCKLQRGIRLFALVVVNYSLYKYAKIVAGFSSK